MGGLLVVLLTVLFVGLKLASIILWSWWCVLMPIILFMLWVIVWVFVGALVNSGT